VKDGCGQLTRELCSRRRSRLDGPDPAQERARALDRSELPLGRRDDEEH
jgi:hypothetical protein